MNPWEKYAPAAVAGPWSKYGSEAPSQTPAPDVQPQGIPDALANAFGQGATFNFGDEAAAFIRSRLPEFSDWMMKGGALQRDPSIGGSPTPQTVSKASTEEQRYDEELARIRAQTAADAKANPNLMEGANIAGNVAGGLALTPALPSALTTVGPRLLANVGKTALVGGGLGGVSGFGSGEGGLENRVQSAALPAVAGTLLGGALPVAGVATNAVAQGPVGRFAARNLFDPVQRAFTGTSGPLQTAAGEGAESVIQRGMLDRLVRASQRGRIDPTEAQTTLNRLGDQAMPADVNPQFRALAETMYTLPGQTYAHAENVLPARALGAPRRMIGALETGGAPPEAATLARAFDENITNVGRTSYQGDMVDAGLRQSTELRGMLDNPLVDNAIKEVLRIDKLARQGRPDAPPLTPVEVMHRVKQMVLGHGYKEGTAIPGPNMQSFRDLADDYTGTLKRDNPALANADVLYSEAKSLPEFFQTGVGALGKQSATEAGIDKSARAIADVLLNATPQQGAAARAGFINAGRMQAEEGTPSALALAKRFTESEPLQRKAASLTGQEAADRILQQAQTERTFQATSQGIRGNSATARRAANAADDIDVGNLQVRVDPRGITTRAIEGVGNFLRNVTSPNEAVRDELGRALLNPDAPQNARLLQALAEALQRRAAAGMTRGTAAGTAANQINEAVR